MEALLFGYISVDDKIFNSLKGLRLDYDNHKVIFLKIVRLSI